jgi:succinate-semialdehyde dehydrogenase/glutarate-semialdehyde dehydrogenase
VIIKGADEVPSATRIVVRALQEAGLPDGVVNLLHGDAPAISEQLLDSATVRAFSFTGSTAVGKRLAQRAAGTLKRCVLELGGHSPVLVFADADLDASVAAIAAYKFECAGQSCNAPSRVYIERSVYDGFADRMATTAREWQVGDPLRPDTAMGPMANSRRLAAMTRLTDDAVSKGAHLMSGGARLASRGYFWPPTVIKDVPATAVVMSEEPFGPLLALRPFDSFEEAIASADANPYGLASYVFTASQEVARKAAAALAAGSVGVNELRGVAPDVPSSGIKDSGYGFEGGRAGIEAFLNLKVVRGL